MSLGWYRKRTPILEPSQSKVVGREVAVPEKELAKRDHRRGLAAVVRADEDGRVLREIYSYGLQLAEMSDFNVFDVHR